MSRCHVIGRWSSVTHWSDCAGDGLPFILRSVRRSGEHRGAFQLQKLRVKGFHEVFLRPHPDRASKLVDVGRARHDNDRDGWMAVLHFLEDGHAAEDRHIHFEQHACERRGGSCLSETCESRYAVVFPLSLESPLGQLAADSQADVIIMIDDEDAPPHR